MTARLYTILLCSMFLLFLICGYVQAVPAFARREGVSCQVCHFRMPELNKTGQDYAMRGFRFDKAPENPSAKPSNIQWDNYLTAAGHHQFLAMKHAKSTFVESRIDLWAAGPINPKWTILADQSFDLVEGGSHQQQSYGQYVTKWSDRFGSVRFGKFIPFAIFLNQGGPRMSATSPIILNIQTFPGLGWTPEAQIRGLEIGILDPGKANFYLGAGQPRVEHSMVFGDPSFKNHTDLYGSGEWVIDPAGDNVTAYGYWGTAWLGLDVPDEPFHRIGIFGNIYRPDTKITLGYLAGSDHLGFGSKFKESGYFVLGERNLSDKLAGYIRYDHDRLSGGDFGAISFSGPTVGISWWVQNQARLNAEAEFIKFGDLTDNMFVAELTWAL